MDKSGSEIVDTISKNGKVFDRPAYRWGTWKGFSFFESKRSGKVSFFSPGQSGLYRLVILGQH